jgi:penicillin-binding protein 1C
VWTGLPDGSTRPGSIGRNTAAPLLLNIFDLLPPEPAARPLPPKDAIIASSPEALPRALRHFDVQRAAGTGFRAPAQPLEIAFPPNGATVELKPSLALHAQGGRGALFWVVDGVPLKREVGDGRHTAWNPQGPGFAKLTVIDGAGQSASSLVKLVATP